MHIPECNAVLTNIVSDVFLVFFELKFGNIFGVKEVKPYESFTGLCYP